MASISRWKVIQLLIQKHPDALTKKNREGELPLHFACAFSQSREVIDLLVRQHPDAIKKKNKKGILPLHLACARKGQSLKVIQLVVQRQPKLISERAHNGKTPLDYAKHHAGDSGTDPKIVEWLEAVASGQINPANLPPALPKLYPGHGEKETHDPNPLPTTAVDKDCATVPALAANDDTITMDRKSVLAVLVGKNEMAAVSPLYIESTRTEEILGDGFFGTVYKAADTTLKRSFAVKLIKTDVLWGGHTDHVQKAKEEFLTEMKVRHVPLCTFVGQRVIIKVANLLYSLQIGIFALATSKH